MQSEQSRKNKGRELTVSCGALAWAHLGRRGARGRAAPTWRRPCTPRWPPCGAPRARPAPSPPPRPHPPPPAHRGPRGGDARSASRPRMRRRGSGRRGRPRPRRGGGGRSGRRESDPVGPHRRRGSGSRSAAERAIGGAGDGRGGGGGGEASATLGGRERRGWGFARVLVLVLDWERERERDGMRRTRRRRARGGWDFLREKREERGMKRMEAKVDVDGWDGLMGWDVVDPTAVVWRFAVTHELPGGRRALEMGWAVTRLPGWNSRPLWPAKQENQGLFGSTLCHTLTLAALTKLAMRLVYCHTCGNIFFLALWSHMSLS